MTHTNFRDYMKDIQKLYKDAKSELDRINATWQQAQKDYKAVLDGTSVHKDLAIAEYKYIKAQDAYKTDIDDLKGRVRYSRVTLREGIEKLAKKYYSTDPSKLDEKAIKLLDLDIMTDEELDRLVEEYKFNPTMLRDNCFRRLFLFYYSLLQ